MRLKFVDLNLWLGGLLFDGILEYLNKEKPDILATQEVYNSHDPKLDKRFRSVDVLQHEAGFEHVFFAPTNIAKLDIGDIEVGNAIFSRYPIVKSNTIFFDVPFGVVSNYEEPGGDYSQTPRNLQHAVIEVNGKRLNIFNTQGIWGKDSNDNGRRMQMCQAIADQVRDKENVILTGDFNIVPETESIKLIEKELRNVFKNKVQTTFNTKQKSNPVFANLVVDMVFANNNLKIVEQYVPEVDTSDHLPLVCVIEI